MAKPRNINGIGDLQPDAHNANRGTERGVGMLEQSLRTYGAGRSILCDRNGVVIAGNKTLERAADLGMEVEVVQSDGKRLVVVQRTDLDLAEDPKARELAYADNRAGQVGLDWDMEQIIKDISAGIDLDKFWLPGEMDLPKDLPPPDASPQLGALEYRIIVTCRDEEHHAEVLSKLQKEGLECKVLIS
jgi:hypothetical protein